MNTQKYDLLTPPEAAELLRTTKRALAAARCLRRDTPPYLRVGRRVLYRRSDIDAWLAERVVDPRGEEVGHEC
ncbi:MAG TPA: helix-turn-helix domain-containing protein [Terriglobia bacterium]|nr:helix-turn-helix domain-containing protein [Terriglobia bacterium]